MLPALHHDAMLAQQDQIAHAEMLEMLGNGNARRARAVDDAGDILHLFAHQLEGVDQRGGHHNGGAMLVIMENGNITDFLQLALDLKATGGADILQIDAAKAAGEQVHRADDLIHILALDAQGEGVHIAKFLEQDALALHHRHARLRADIAKAQNRRAIGDHSHQIVAAGQLVRFIHIRMDGHAGLRNAGGIGQRQGAAVLHLGPGHHFQLAGPLIMLLKGFLSNIHPLIRSFGKSAIGCFILALFTVVRNQGTGFIHLTKPFLLLSSTPNTTKENRP